jgi:hypothetical protein
VIEREDNTREQNEFKKEINHLQAKMQTCTDTGIQAAFANAKNRLQDLRTRATTLDKKVEKYHKHVKQFKVCRKAVQSQEENLKPGECLVYRDFVNQHTCSGNKMINLVLVCIWKEESGDKFMLKLNHFCSDVNSSSSDPYYVADVFDFHLHEKDQHHSGFLSSFHTIYISGDHGSHFSSIATMYNESRMKFKYSSRPKIHVLSLCSYHCYNLCDGAGVESKRQAKDVANEKAGRGPTTSTEYTVLVNDGAYRNSRAVDFTSINRSKDIFLNVKDPKKNKKSSMRLRNRCEVVFEWKVEGGGTESKEGIILCRDVMPDPDTEESGEPFEVFDLMERPTGETMCVPCSKTAQRPLFHLTSNTCTQSRAPLGKSKQFREANLKQQ